MRTQRAIQFVYTLIFMTWTHTDAASTKRSPLCPIGFSLANPKDGDPICYRQKGPETFSESFNDCTGNLYTAKLYNSIDLPRTNKVLWTEYKSKYPGGPFIDWSYTDSTGDILLTTFDVKYDSSLGIDEELCVVIDPVSNFTATSCDGKHYRYCFVKPYNDDDDKVEGCTDFRGSWRFYSPSATCLAPVTGVGGGPVRATWRQAQDMCFKRGGSLVNRGWRFSNHPSLSLSGSLPMFPLGVVTNQDQSLVEFEEISGLTEIPKSEWHFQKNRFSNDATLGAVRNDFWYLVNSSYIFFDVICERPVQLKNISLELIVNWENKIILTVNDTIKKDFFRCFTDSRTIYSSEVSISRSDDHKQTFTLSPAVDGYYWCIHNNYKDYQISESNKVLFIRSRESLVNLYACKIRFRSEYRMENLDKLNKVTRKRLEEFVYYRTKYIDIYGEINTTNAYRLEKLLKTFKSEKPDLDWKDSDVIYSLQLKRLYMDLRSALVHVTLNPEMKPLLPGRWEGLEVEYMRPAYFCPAFDSVPSRALGESVTSTGCRTFTCIGDFNEGVQWLVTATQACSTSVPAAVTRMINLEDVMPTAMAPTTTADHKYLMHERTSESSEESPEKPMTRSTTKETTPCITIEFTEGYYDFSTVSPPTEVVTVTTPPDVSTVTTPPDTTELPTTIKPPRPTPLPPEEQLDQVLDDLAVLLQNDSIPIDAISDTFDQVNDILDVQDEDLQIPGQLLHMLDELGSRVQLDGAPTATKIRENIALLLADATPQNPIRGLKVAVRDSDAFTNNSFAFIDDVITDDQLLANETEALVYLPDSITRTPRRVSFVAFRNQKAFQSDLVVNSRVFSINVENLTHFDDGEMHKNDTLQANTLIDTILATLDDLIENNTVCITDTGVVGVFDMINTALCEEETYGDSIGREFLEKLDKFGGKVRLDNERTAVVAQDNVAFLVADVSPDHPIRGMSMTGKNNGFGNNSFEFITEKTTAASLATEDMEALILLPESLMQVARRISFVVFGNDVAFTQQQDTVVNSYIFSINVENLTMFEQGETLDLHLKPFRKPHRNESRACAYWNFAENGTGYWSQDGCTLVRSRRRGSSDICRCDHLTRFAEVLLTKDVFTERQESFLEVVSKVGCCFSIFGTLAVALTSILFKSWRRNDSNKIWLNLCLAVFALNVCFLVTVFTKFEEYTIDCILTGIALHYSVLATFCWMLVVSILTYRKLVLVFTKDIPKKFLMASVFSWGFPCLIIGILLSVDFDAYSRKFEERAPNGAFCYPSGLGLLLAVLAPVAAICLVNWTLYGLIVRSMFVNKNIRRHTGSRENFRSASVSCLLAFVCGVPWVFGFFAFNIVAAYLFRFTVSFQGFVLFLFFVLANGKTRSLWLNIFRNKGMDRSSLTFSSRRRTRSSIVSRFYVPKPIVSPHLSDVHNSLLAETRM